MASVIKEAARLAEAREQGVGWKRWGPYLSERQWGTVREDYSANGDAWDDFPHDQARSRAYQWGEDGIAGFCDDQQRLCFSLALWNGKDPILKERLFGLTNSEGNHGEDVKEYYFYLDSDADALLHEDALQVPAGGLSLRGPGRGPTSARTRNELEYELLDTGVFDDEPVLRRLRRVRQGRRRTTSCIRITVVNRGPEPALAPRAAPPVVPQHLVAEARGTGPGLARRPDPHRRRASWPSIPSWGTSSSTATSAAELLFTDNETNNERLWGQPNADAVRQGRHQRLRRPRAPRRGEPRPTRHQGGRAPSPSTVGPVGRVTVRLRLSPLPPGAIADPFGTSFDAVFAARQREADEFYAAITPEALSDRRGQRHAAGAAPACSGPSSTTSSTSTAGWRSTRPDPISRRRARMPQPRLVPHVSTRDIISMPDKWEYPWFAAWDLAFHTVALDAGRSRLRRRAARADAARALSAPERPDPRLRVELRRRQPARARLGDVCFHYRHNERLARRTRRRVPQARLPQADCSNFNWWLNRKDPRGPQPVQRRLPGPRQHRRVRPQRPAARPAAPGAGRRHRLDGLSTARTCSRWPLELAKTDPAYEDSPSKFVEHFLWIAGGMDRVGDNTDELWDEEDGFFYDVLALPDGSAQRLKVRSMVGLLPLCRDDGLPSRGRIERFPRVRRTRSHGFTSPHPELMANIHPLGQARRQRSTLCCRS